MGLIQRKEQETALMTLASRHPKVPLRRYEEFSDGKVSQDDEETPEYARNSK